MTHPIPEFTPFIPSDKALCSSSLPDKAMQLSVAAARLSGQTPQDTRRTIVGHMAVINSYYSNLIEGHRTLPHEIRAAQAGDFSADPAKRDLQLESLAHIRAQQWLNQQQPDLDVLYQPGFIRQIHEEFYRHIPDSLHHIRDVSGNIVEQVAAGSWREKHVIVGNHAAPEPRAIPALMNRFCEVYHPARFTGDRKILAVLCAHHRLAWIHPFTDGNGRVIRLFTDTALRAVGLESTGVWCLSRGLARNSVGYKTMLARADTPRQGDLDGRGVLSERNLMAFCEFMLDTAIDQVRYMGELLKLENMQERITGYIRARNDGRVPGMGRIKESAAMVLYNAFTIGDLPRSFALELCAAPERSARRLLAQLRVEGLLSESSSRSGLRWEIPEHAEPWYFPQLTPGEFGSV